MNTNPRRDLNAAFRVDASLDIGTGHVMRCLTLADVLAGVDISCRFVCRDHPGNLMGVIRQRGFHVETIPSGSVSRAVGKSDLRHASWLGCDWMTDAQQTRAALSGVEIDWLIVDHYALDVQWEREMRSNVRSLIVIDDLADRCHDCDLLLDQSFGRNADDYQPLVSESCRLLIGSGYALLRPQFARRRLESLERRKSASPRTILVSLGGVDKGNYTRLVLDTLKGCQLSAQTKILVVMGPHAPWLEDVRTLSTQMPWATQVLTNVEDMADLMVRSDLAMGAAGSTSWERCALGLPTILLVVADNQRKVGQRLFDEGAAILVEMDANFSLTLREAVNNLVSDNVLLDRMARCSATICDGGGCDRVLDALIDGMRKSDHP